LLEGPAFTYVVAAAALPAVTMIVKESVVEDGDNAGCVDEEATIITRAVLSLVGDTVGVEDATSEKVVVIG